MHNLDCLISHLAADTTTAGHDLYRQYDAVSVFLNACFLRGNLKNCDAN